MIENLLGWISIWKSCPCYKWLLQKKCFKFLCLKICETSSFNLFAKLAKSINKISKSMCDSLSSTKVLLVIFKDNLKQGKRTKHISYFHNNKYDWLTLKKRGKRLILFSLIPNNRILPSDFKLLTEHTWISRDFFETNILQIISKIRIKLMVSIWSTFVCQDYVDWRKTSETSLE